MLNTIHSYRHIHFGALGQRGDRRVRRQHVIGQSTQSAPSHRCAAAFLPIATMNGPCHDGFIDSIAAADSILDNFGYSIASAADGKEWAPGDQHRAAPNAHLTAPWPMELG